MANTYITESLVEAALISFRYKAQWLGTTKMADSSPYIDKKRNAGESYKIYLENRTTVTVGYSSTPKDIIDRTMDVTVQDMLNTHFDINSAIFKRASAAAKIDEKARIILPTLTEIGIEADKQVTALMQSAAYWHVGDPTADLSSSVEATAGATLASQLQFPSEEKLFFALSHDQESQLKSIYNNNFNQVVTKDVLGNGTLGAFDRYDEVWASELVPLFTSEFTAATTATISGGPVATGNQLTLDFGGGTEDGKKFYPGDLITVGDSVAAPFAYNDVGILLSRAPQFIVTEESAAVTAGAVTITVSPEIITDPQNPYRNISGPIATGTTVTIAGSYRSNFVYIPSAIIRDPQAGPEKLYVPEEQRITQDGISLWMGRQGDISNMTTNCRLSYQTALGVDARKIVRVLTKA